MTISYTLDQYVRDLRTITSQETDPVKIPDLVAPLAKKFAQSPELRRPEYRECDDEQGFGVHMLHEEPNHDLAVFLVSWLPNRGTTPHNHKTWAVVVGIEGQEQEISYERLDDGTMPGYADLERSGEQVMTAGDIARCYPRTHSHRQECRKRHFDVAAHLWPAHQLHWSFRVRSRAQARKALRD